MLLFINNKINKSKDKYQKVILLFFLIYIFINSSNIISPNNHDFLFNNLKNYYIFNQFACNKSYKLINKNFTKKQYIEKGLSYFNEIKKKKLNNITKQINKVPKVSVIIPIYNSEKTIELSVKSVHFQNINDIEIILINDFSTDNSSKIIEELNNFDQRILIINNKKNMGTLYSRCIGALNARGEYIIGLDNDDFFLYEETLETVYLNAKVNNFDIVEIKSLNIFGLNPSYGGIWDGDFTNLPNNLILNQPELGRFSISNNDQLNLRDHFAWGKCINSDIYKKAVNKLGQQRYSIYNCWTEDISIVFILFNTAKSFIFLNIYGIFRFKYSTQTTYKLSNKHKLLSDIFFLEILFDFSYDDSITKKYVAQYALTFPSESINKLDINNKSNLKSMIKKIIECKYISLQYKQKILNKFNNTINDM